MATFDVLIPEGRFMELLEEEHWGAYNAGLSLGGDWWQDGGRSDAEWLTRELGLEPMGRYPAAQIREGVEALVARKYAQAPRQQRPPEES